MRRFPVRGFLVAAAIIALIVFIATQSTHRNRGDVKSFTTFEQQLESGGVAKIRIRDTEFLVTPTTGDPYTTFVPTPPTDLTPFTRRGVDVEAAPPSQDWSNIVVYALPILLMVGLLFYLMRGARGGGDGAVSFGKSRARLVSEENTNVLFRDVAGVEEAKDDLTEVVEFLKNPAKFHALGARIPHGVLMVGPPGSGKTHLAKAVAGEAKVPFFSISGSDFVEMFVGVGAARVRDLFETAKKNTPCIVFIDEIDAVGRRRGLSINGGNDEREQTLNALLVEMDGFETQHDIIIVAATNRPDVLDPALLRPGRFDRQVVVDAPDVRGREAILRIHARGKPLSRDVELRRVAQRTPGFVGADLENLLNEAALVAARAGRREIAMPDIDEAADRVVMGPERRSRVISEREKRVTAYHEAGHALAAYLLEFADPVHKITIVPRGRAMGYVMQFPEEDRMAASRNMLLDRIGVALAGRATEQMVFEDVTTGAQNDFEQATEIARRMVTRWGMSSALGNVALTVASESYLGEADGPRSYSEDTAKLVDSEIKGILDGQYQRIEALLLEHRPELERIVNVLLVRETLHADEFGLVLRGEVLPDPIEVADVPGQDRGRSSAGPVGRADEGGQEPRLPPGMMPRPG